MKRHWDKLGHILVCFLVALYRADYAIVMAVTIELVQIARAFVIWYDKGGSFFWNVIIFLKTYNWRDTILDLVSDAIGIALAIGLWYYVFTHIILN